MNTEKHLEQWHHLVKERNPDMLDNQLADDAVLMSPVLHKPLEGKAIVTMYLTAALHVFANEHFKYRREFTNSNGAVLEFETEIDGIHINGIDMITWDENGKIINFTVMVRPMKALQTIQQKMAEMLESFNQ